jgi:hypothetical protein
MSLQEAKQLALAAAAAAALMALQPAGSYVGATCCSCTAGAPGQKKHSSVWQQVACKRMVAAGQTCS